MGDHRARSVAASARPKNEASKRVENEENEASKRVENEPAALPPPPEPAPRRSARIVALSERRDDEHERLRSKLLDRLVSSEGRSAITRAAREFRDAGFEFPLEQRVQLQLLEHLDEQTVCSAIQTLGELVSREAPLKAPVLDQRLRRLEEYAEDAATRMAAADLRRLVRSRQGGAPALRDR